MATKHCHNCKHLEWAHGEEDDHNGWVCDKPRHFEPIARDDARTIRLEDEAYRMRGKVCFEPEEPRPNGQ